MSKQTNRFEKLISEIFSEFGAYRTSSPSMPDEGYDLVVSSENNKLEFRFALKVRARITPQIADNLFTKLNSTSTPKNVTRVVMAPVISERVREIAQKHGISYLDHAGNCLIKNEQVGLFILRTGKKAQASDTEPPTIDIFSAKSSRIVRAMLSEPKRRWQVSELSKHVGVSAGLASKVKQSLVFNNYATVENRLLKLTQTLELLQAWLTRYEGGIETKKFYVRGDVEDIENKISHWCHANNHRYALARFSAAWRRTPEVRYSVASLYVGASALTASSQEKLRDECGASEVESGANLIFLTPYDSSVFYGADSNPTFTSALQTWLDLKTMSGRGEEAADAIYKNHLRNQFEQNLE